MIDDYVNFKVQYKTMINNLIIYPKQQNRGPSHKPMDWTPDSIIPIGSMYAIYGNIYHQYTPNVSIYTIHGSYGID